MIEENLEVYPARFPEDKIWFVDLIYIDHLDCYLLNYENKIYRKDIDGEEPYLYLDLDCGYKNGKSYSYSKIHPKLIVINNLYDITVANLERKQVQILIQTGHDSIEDFQIFGKRENHIVWATYEGLIRVCSISYDLRKICTMHRHKIELI